MDFMGHKSLSTTMKYIHVNEDALLLAAKNLNPSRGVGA
jgi:site-specific recombinase XerD